MRPATRMMMISSLGENNERRMGYEGEGRPSQYDEAMRRDREDRRRANEEHERNRGEPESYYGPQNRRMDGYQSRRGGRRMEANNWDSEGQRPRYERQMRGGSGYEGREGQMGFTSMSYEDGDEDVEGSFRPGKAQGHISQKHQEMMPKDERDKRLKAWVEQMQNTDGTTGAHYKMDQANLIRANWCPDADPMEFWATLNMIYSDYSGVAKQLGMDRVEFFGAMTKAFLDDKDAGKGKLEKYMRYVAGK